MVYQLHAHFYGQFTIIVALLTVISYKNFLNNSSTPVIQRSIFNISMVNESDPTYTQHITTSNSYLDRIHILQPFENYRRVTKRYFGENVATPEIKQ